MIEINNLYKSFDSKPVLTGVTVLIRDRERLVILGRSGSGKTVLLKCIIGLLKADRGEILVDGTDIVRTNRRSLFTARKQMGFVFQASALLDSLTVEANIGLALREQGMSRARIRQTVEEKLGVVGLEPRVAGQYPQELSGGQKKLVAIARAVALQPRYLFYDEPSTGLDPHVRDQIIALILDLARQFAITSVIVTHDLFLARKTGERLLFLKAGKLALPEHVERIEDFYE
jgi:phospholipid/cholesterol/gamma-HCH transport system ATP-binding protein